MKVVCMFRPLVLYIFILFYSNFIKYRHSESPCKCTHPLLRSQYQKCFKMPKMHKYEYEVNWMA